MAKRFDNGGQRVTSCCGSYSTYMDASDDPMDDQVLCCKACYNEVEFGEGDGSEVRAGGNEDLYHSNLAAEKETWIEQSIMRAKMERV